MRMPYNLSGTRLKCTQERANKISATFAPRKLRFTATFAEQKVPLRPGANCDTYRRSNPQPQRQRLTKDLRGFLGRELPADLHQREVVLRCSSLLESIDNASPQI
jgi:hypothetical protein